jgi:hypothetical protein
MPGPVIHWHAAGIAKRVLGDDSPVNRRLVLRWSSEIEPADRPFPIHKSGKNIYALEHEIPGALATNP